MRSRPPPSHEEKGFQRTAHAPHRIQKKTELPRHAGARGDGREDARGTPSSIQKHAATRLHYDFRLEMDGVLKSWAVPKGPSLDPAEKRLAVHVEDHPLDYGDFEGIIPKGEYGGGTVLLWDRGTWTPVGDPVAGYAKGDFKFELDGEKLHGRWVLVRMGSRDRRGWPRELAPDQGEGRDRRARQRRRRGRGISR